MRILVAQLGARRHYVVPLVLHEAGLLERLFTDGYAGNKPWLERVLRAIPPAARPASIERWLGRKEPRIPPEKVRSFDRFGLRYFAAQRRAPDLAALSQTFATSGQRFGEEILADCPPEADAIWAFNGAALELFRWGKERGMRCILDQTSAPRRVMRRLMVEELERWPGWEADLQLPPEPDPLAEREEAEWQLADRIIAGSTFVVEGIRECGGPTEKGVVVPYGVDTSRFTRCAPRARPRGAKLRVLFAGVVSLMKGVPYLLEALRQLASGGVDARLAGKVVLARDRLAAYEGIVTFLGPVPRAQMPALYEWADVLVLPSLSEGSAGVTYEALACGVPVICTPNAGSIIRDGIDGFIVPPRDSHAIFEKLLLIRNGGLDPPVVPQTLGTSAAYGERLIAAVRSLA